MVGESIAEASNFENKMGESVTSGATLEVSVSFGRFENDSLSWEKWSSFSPNKYLEEVEKCSTPGSVAQKKAYFEAHYKKIAARKAAEQLEQENLMESAPSQLNELKSEDHIVKNTGSDAEFGGCNGERSREEIKQEADKMLAALEAAKHLEQEKLMQSAPPRLKELTTKNLVENNTADDTEFGVCNGERSTEEVKEEADVGSMVNSITFDGIKEDVVSVGECQSSSGQDIKEELSGSVYVNTTESNDREKAVLLGVERTSQKSFPDMKQALEVDSGNRRASEGKNKNANVKARNITEKKTPTKKDQIVAGPKKKVPSSETKSSPISAPPRLLRPTPTSPLKSASQSSSKKSNGTLLARNKNTPVKEIRRAAPTSLHMSLSLGPANSSVSSASTRKSLIMEQMADKDIIKRAFKAFQTNYGQLRSSIDDKFNGVSKVSLEVPEQKIGPSTPKENEGLRIAADKRNTLGGQLETKFRSSGLGSSVPKKNVKAATHAVGPKSDERPEKRREFLKNLEQKSIARQAEKAQLGAKSKERDGELEKLKLNSHLNATPVQTYSKGGVSKSSQKVGVKNKVHLPSR